MVTDLRRREDWRQPGCDDRCRVERVYLIGRGGAVHLPLHAPEAHYAQGRADAIAALPVGEAAVRTGRLLIDRWQRAAFVDGVDVELTGREWELLDYLACNRGRYCSAPEIMRALWDDLAQPHYVHVYMTRLRSRLGVGAHLIETRRCQGYRLRLEPAGTDGPAPVRRRRWAQDHDACVCCGRTARAHMSHGRCTRCQYRPSRAAHYGPCMAPKVSPDGAS